jgi:hypothetical protein
MSIYFHREMWKNLSRELVVFFYYKNRKQNSEPSSSVSSEGQKEKSDRNDLNYYNWNRLRV